MKTTGCRSGVSTGKSPEREFRDKRGSILMVAIIFATIAAISIGSYIRLAMTEVRLANNQFYSNASLNLAEAGVEEALYALNLDAWSETDWGQSDNANTRTNLYQDIELGPGATGEIRVRVTGARGDTPRVISEGEVFSGGGASTSKQIEVMLRRRSLFANGITSRSFVVISGNGAYIASYRSSDPDTLINDLDNGSIATILVLDESIDLGNAELRGWLATGGGMPDWRPNATVGSHDAPSGNVDTERISLDFTSSFPDVEVPDFEFTPLPYDGSGGEIGVSGEERNYVASSVSLQGGSGHLTVHGDVTLVVDEDFRVGGSGEVTIMPGGSLTLYVGGDLSIGGNGIANADSDYNIPKNLQIYGFGEGENDWSVGGGPSLFAAMYAPNANFDIHGGSEVRGSIIGNQVRLRGSVSFWYDEDLRDLFTDERFAMSHWRELYGDDRHSF